MLDVQPFRHFSDKDLTGRSSKKLSLWRPSSCAVVHLEYLEPLADVLEVGDD